MSQQRKRILSEAYYASDGENDDDEHQAGPSTISVGSVPLDNCAPSSNGNDHIPVDGKRTVCSPKKELSSEDVIYLSADANYDNSAEDDPEISRTEFIEPFNVSERNELFEEEKPFVLPIYCPGISGCRSVSEYECLNRIEEGTYGVVYRAIEKKTDKVVALKRLKMEKEKEGFPITSLREVNMLLKCANHQNIVNVREVVVGSNMDKIYMVMEYVEHELKSLMELMKSKSKKFTLAQVKTLMKQLLSGCEYMHNEFVIHRDLKTSNLLMTHNGILKIGDFGLAREYGDPLKAYTPIVVTLWYRAPELLLRTKKYSTEVDMWSVGCIFAEFLKFKPLFPGTGDIDQINKIFLEIGTPNEEIWPGYNELWGAQNFQFTQLPYNQLYKKFSQDLPTEAGLELLTQLLAACPSRRCTATEGLKSSWFSEEPFPVSPHMFPTWPAKSEQNKMPASSSNVEPKEESPMPELSSEDLKLLADLNVDVKEAASGFTLKFGAPKKKRKL